LTVLHPASSIIQRAVWHRIPSLGLPEHARVLDAPCGSGFLTHALRDAGYEANGVDIDGAAAPLLGGAFRLADLSGPLAWPDATFHAAFSIEGIEHLENRHAFLRELARVLKPDGILVLTTPNTLNVRSRVRFFSSGFFHQDPRPLREDAPQPLHHIGLATFPELRYALHTSGFEITDVSCTHIKPVSWAYAVLVPWIWIYTAVAFRKEKDPRQRLHNRVIRRTLVSRPLLFGENLMLIAKKRR
jgi:2-polyprenyl-3-methyl-5-hydroxy-6-metoxy-1,4-benzoquinol methylase